MQMFKDALRWLIHMSPMETVGVLTSENVAR